MPKIRDLAGQRFERLTVICQDERVGRYVSWKCVCDCGNIVRRVLSHNLIDKHTKSCGCLHDELVSERNRRPIRYYIDGDTAVCTTYSGVMFYVDSEDINRVKVIGWSLGTGGYLYGGIPGTRKKVRLHRYILNVSDDVNCIDHIDKNKLNNRKNNLRICSTKENARNSREKEENKSGFSGVSRCKDSNKWRARIVVDGKEISLGRYEKYEEAVLARFYGEKKYYGDFAPHTEQDVAFAIKKHEEEMG